MSIDANTALSTRDETFDFGALGPAVAAEVRAIEERFIKLRWGPTPDVVHNGILLLRARKLLPEHLFQDFIRLQLDIWSRTAREYMGAAQLVETYPEFLQLSAPALWLLVGEPESVLLEVQERLRSGREALVDAVWGLCKHRQEKCWGPDEMVAALITEVLSPEFCARALPYLPNCSGYVLQQVMEDYFRDRVKERSGKDNSPDQTVRALALTNDTARAFVTSLNPSQRGLLRALFATPDVDALTSEEALKKAVRQCDGAEPPASEGGREVILPGANLNGQVPSGYQAADAGKKAGEGTGSIVELVRALAIDPLGEGVSNTPATMANRVNGRPSERTSGSVFEDDPELPECLRRN